MQPERVINIFGSLTLFEIASSILWRWRFPLRKTTRVFFFLGGGGGVLWSPLRLAMLIELLYTVCKNKYLVKSLKVFILQKNERDKNK